MKDQQTKEQFMELRASGMSYQKIADQLQVSKQTLITWSRELKHEIANLRAISRDALQEEYYVMTSKRIELFGKKLESLQTELADRDLSSVPTEKLLDLVLKYGKALKEEEAKTVFAAVTETTIDDQIAAMGSTKTVETWVA